MNRRFTLVDVFGEQSFSGNPLAVVHDADGLSTAQMQQITRWLNLSESTFLLPPTDPQADYLVRIFTLDREMPFAGHPTLGSCHAWLAAGGVPLQHDQIIQQCGAGLVPIRRHDTALAFAAPALIRSGTVDQAKIQQLADFLHIERSTIVDAQWADNGPGWVVVLLESAEAVLAINPARDYPERMDVGVVGPHPAGSPLAFELRAFFSNQHGAIVEDPVTGSLNASVAQWLIGSGRTTPPYSAAQGTRIGRSGRIAISQDAAGTVWVGGQARTMFAGEATFAA